MNRIWIKTMQVFLVLLLVAMLVLPSNVVFAQEDLPADDGSTPVEETPSIEEGTEEEGGGEEESESVVDDGEPAAEETESVVDDGEPAEEENGSAMEEDVSAGEDEIPAEEQDVPATDEDEPVTEEEGSDEGEDESTTEEGEPAEGDTESAEAEGDGGDTQEDEMGETPSVAEVVQQMADANAQLVDEQGQSIVLASEEAAVLLEANTAALPGIILMSSAAASVSSVISQDNADQLDGGNDGVGQSFTATIDGLLTNVEIGSNSTGSFTLKIYLGAPVTGAELYSQAVVLSDTVNNTGGIVNSHTYNTLTLRNPVAVSQGQTYSFGIEGVMPAMAVDTAGGGASYVDGDLYTLNAGSWSVSLNRDMAFRVHIQGTGGSAGDGVGEVEDGEEEEKTKSLRAQFITKPDDFKLVPKGLRIQGILSYIYEYGAVTFNLPVDVSSDNITIMFWNGSSWSQLPGVIIMEDGIQGPAVGPGTYVMVVN